MSLIKNFKHIIFSFSLLFFISCATTIDLNKDNKNNILDGLISNNPSYKSLDALLYVDI